MAGSIKLSLVLALTGGAVIGSVALLALIGTTFAWSLAVAVALFVAVAWAEAASLRVRGATNDAARMVWFTLLAASMFLAFTAHADELAQQVRDPTGAAAH